MPHPILCHFRISSALVPAQWPNPIPRRDYNLAHFARLKLSGGDATADRSKLDWFKFCTAAVLKPKISGKKVRFAIPVNIKGRDPFRVFEPDLSCLAGFAGENLSGVPGLRVAGIGRDGCEKNLFGPL